MLAKGWGAGRRWYPAQNLVLPLQWEATCVGSFVAIDGRTQEAHGTCLSFQKGKLSPSQLTCSLDTGPQRPVRQRPRPPAHLTSPAAPALRCEQGFDCPLLARIGIRS